jgi:hypothetical protein
LADLLAEGPRSSEELAQATGMHAPSLHRLLRALAGCGVLTEIEPRTFATTALDGALRTGAPGAARATVLTLAGDWQWQAWQHFLDSLRTGEPGLSEAFGTDLFSYLRETPSTARASMKQWSACMRGRTGDRRGLRLLALRQYCRSGRRHRPVTGNDPAVQRRHARRVVRAAGDRV